MHVLGLSFIFKNKLRTQNNALKKWVFLTSNTDCFTVQTEFVLQSNQGQSTINYTSKIQCTKH